MIDGVNLPGPITASDFTLTLIHTPPTLSCTARWQGVITSDLDHFVRLALP